jgi:hypothetical protein
MVLACAHRGTTVLSWGFCEHEGPFDHSFLFSSPCSPTSLHEGGLVDPQLRASNEHILIVRVPRARGRPGLPHFLSLANASSSSAPTRGFQSKL